MTPKRPTDSKSNFDAKPIHTLLRESEALMPFQQRLRQLAKLQKTFVDTLPPGLNEACRVAAVEGSTIIVATANGAVAAKLKQMLPRLLEKFREKMGENKKQYQEVTGFSVIVQPEFFSAEIAPRSGPPREPLPFQKLSELAESLGDSPLKTALSDIASKHQRALTNKQKTR